jgi:hypothetical protein
MNGILSPVSEPPNDLFASVKRPAELQFFAQWFVRRAGVGRLVTLFFLAALRCFAESGREYQVKAVLVVNLVRFVEWPESAFETTNSPIVIGIIGKDPFGQNIDEAVKGETHNGRAMKVERFSAIDPARLPQLLFISASERSRLPRILKSLDHKPVLTVSDIDEFTTNDGMVQIYVNVQNRPRLRINLDAAKAQRLSIAPKLLQIAELVGR